MTCSQCGGDVTRIFVGQTEKYVHAVKGIDHGPLPVQAAMRKQQETAPPTPTSPAIPVAGSPAAPGSLPARKAAI